MKQTILFLENEFADICRQASPHEWEENHISFLLMRCLRRVFGDRRIHFNDWSKIVAWRSYKNRGKAETNYGDIALIVNIQFSSGEYLRGVAALEAKRNFNSGNFESIELPQLERIQSNLPYAHLLLYNQHPQKHHLKFPDSSTWSSHFWVSPINTAFPLLSQTGIRDNWKIIRTSFPFAMFLTSRIFWGLDLDYRDDIRQDIIDGVSKVINPSYLGVVNVFYHGQRPVEIALSDIWKEISEK